MQKANTGIEDATISEAELARLQRQYRVAEGDRKAYNDEAASTLRKQNELIVTLEKDHEFLKRELALAEEAAASREQVEKTNTELVHELQNRELEVREETERLEELTQSIRAAERELSNKRRVVGGLSGVEAHAGKLQGQIQTMENRLEQTLRRYNQQLTSNSKLREEIDHLKQERRVFESLHKKLEKELVDQKRKMAEVIERSHQAYEARDEAQNKMATLEEKANKELQQYNLEIKDMTRVLEHDRKLKTFMGVKAQPRTQEELTVTQRRKAAQQETPEAMVQTYEEAFAKIKAAVGIEDTTRLVDKFIETEDNNFALFNYVNELSNEIEKVSEQINEINGSIRKFNQEGETLDRQRKLALQELEERLAVSEAQAKLYSERQAALSQQLGELKKGIETIFNSPVCDRSTLANMLGNAEVTDANVMQFLGAIEQRTNELLQLRALLDQKEKESWEAREAELREQLEDDSEFDPTATLGPKPVPGGLLGSGPLPPAGALSIVPPSTVDDLELGLEEEEDLSKPMTHAELKQKIALSMTGRRDKKVAA